MPILSTPACIERYRLVSRLFGRDAVSGSVSTRFRLAMSPEIVWRRVMFYEDVPGRPRFLLRTLLPYPVRTAGPRNNLGGLIHCLYRGGGYLTKRIITLDAPHLLEFEVLEQRLGIERCIQTHAGSYRIEAFDRGTDVILQTTYTAYLRPRSLWRRVEAVLIRQLHTHILRGIEGAVDHNPGTVRATIQRTGVQ